MEEEKLKEICEKYCKKERFILLLYRIAKTNSVNNIEESIKTFLKHSVSKKCVKKIEIKKKYDKNNMYKKNI
jgi:hypothetical protein